MALAGWLLVSFAAAALGALASAGAGDATSEARTMKERNRYLNTVRSQQLSFVARGYEPPRGKVTARECLGK